MKRVLSFILIFFLFFAASSFADESRDTPDKKSRIPANLKLDPKNNNMFFSVSNETLLFVNNIGNLMYNKPADLFYPTNYLDLLAYYIFPINRTFGIGPSLYNQNTFKIVHYADQSAGGDDRSVGFVFNTVILPGLSFNITPYHKGLNMPLFLFKIDIGPAIELNNNIEDGDGLTVKIGGFTSQVLTLPIMPIHLFLMDINVAAVMAARTPAGWFPGIRLRNYFIAKFAFFNFISKDAGSGLRIKNTFSYILTGKPSLTDLTSQYTYDRLFVTLYFGKVKGLEVHLGYGFEYVTFARDPIFHMGHKVYSEIFWKKNGFSIRFAHSLIFWENRISSPVPNGLPVNEFELYFSFDNMR